MITSRLYYQSDVHIPNAVNVANSSSLIGKEAQLDRFIDEYERDVLSKCLGYPLSKEFRDQLEIKSGETTETPKDSAPQKWKDLFNGKEYTIEGKSYYWKGLVFTIGSNKYSLLAHYVFFHYLQSDYTKYVGTGVKIEKSQNTIIANPTPLLVRSWNRFYEMTVKGKQSGVRSLYEFIEDMNSIDASNFPNWDPYCFSNMNQFGI